MSEEQKLAEENPDLSKARCEEPLTREARKEALKKEKEAKREEKRTIKGERKAKKRREKIEKVKKKYGLRLFPANKKGKHVMHRLNFLRFLFYPIHALVYPFKRHGHYKVADGPCIFVGNHYSIYDIFYPAHATGEGVHYILKESILAYPVIGKWAMKIGAIPAARDGADVRTVMDALRVLKNGEKVSLFPEGTRNRFSDDRFLPFKSGASLFAIKSKTPVIPFVICNRPRVFHKTHVVFGEPMYFDEYYEKRTTPELIAEADEKIVSEMYRLREEFFAQKAAKKTKKNNKKEGK